jgi:hypothetical protein
MHACCGRSRRGRGALWAAIAVVVAVAIYGLRKEPKPEPVVETPFAGGPSAGGAFTGR